jgi:membrane-associated phospholipid phosphatase
MSRLQSLSSPASLDASRRDGEQSSDPVPALEAQPGSPSARLAQRFRGRSPLLVFSVLTLAGWVLLAAVVIGAGFLLVDVALPHGVARPDESINDWLARQRTSSLDDASYVGSSIGDIPFIPGLVILTALVAAVLRLWRVAGLIVGGILVEVATYRIASLIVHRDRPSVPRMDQLPVDQSYPSGHVAAAIVVYVGLALVIASRVRRRSVTLAVWSLAFALPLIVALSRMYRGMHHMTDSAAGVLIGLASLVIALVAVRTAGEVAERGDRS